MSKLNKVAIVTFAAATVLLLGTIVWFLADSRSDRVLKEQQAAARSKAQSDEIRAETKVLEEEANKLEKELKKMRAEDEQPRQTP